MNKHDTIALQLVHAIANQPERVERTLSRADTSPTLEQLKQALLAGDRTEVAE